MYATTLVPDRSINSGPSAQDGFFRFLLPSLRKVHKHLDGYMGLFVHNHLLTLLLEVLYLGFNLCPCSRFKNFSQFIQFAKFCDGDNIYTSIIGQSKVHV